MRDSLGVDYGSDGQVQLHDIGKRVILSLSFIGRQRHMVQCYQDAMAVACYFGKIDYFITMTANPK